MVIKLGAFVAREVREVMPATILFLVLFHMIALTKAVSLGDYSRSAFRATTTTVGALIVAKAILVVEALPITRLFSRHRAIFILWKTLLFGAVALLFQLVEEVIELASKLGGWAALRQRADHADEGSHPGMSANPLYGYERFNLQHRIQTEAFCYDGTP